MEADVHLVYRALRGDRDAFGLLIRMYHAEVYAIALSIAGNPTDAEDLTQEAFIKAYLNLPRLKCPGRFGAWLRRITQNHCKDWLRTQSQQYLPIDNLLAEEQLTFPPADTEILRDDFGKALVSALASLKEADRQILKLFYVYGFRYDEITRASGLSYSAAASRLHKAKKRIKALMGDFASPPDAGAAIMDLSGGVYNMELGLSTDILDGIRTVEYAQSTETEERQFLCGVYLERTRGNGFCLVATDGRRLAVAHLPDDGGEEDISLLIPTEELDVLKDALQESAAVSVERVDGDMAIFYIGDTRKLIKLGPGRFPDHRAVIRSPMRYAESTTLEREAAIHTMEKIVEAGGSSFASDWVQWGNTMYISYPSDILAVREVVDRSIETCYMLLSLITRSTSPEELSDGIFGYLPREEYQRLLSELEKRAAPPQEPVGTLEIIDSEGDARFVGRFNSCFLLDAFRAMKGDTIKMRYRMENHSNVTLKPLLMEDDNNIHVIMPMKVE